jgi:hypothetical protein
MTIEKEDRENLILYRLEQAEETIICPKNLVPMWEDYAYKYQLRAKVMSITRVQGKLPNSGFS